MNWPGDAVMRRFAYCLLLLLPLSVHAVFLDCAFFDGFENPNTTDAAALGALEVHNCARKTVTPAASTPIPQMTWNTTVAGTAQDWANGCNYAHGDHVGLGQNIYAAASTDPNFTATLTDASLDWASEQPYYNYAANTCSAPNPPGTCGHYTQAVWSSTVQLGCGIKFCTTGTPFPPPFLNWYFIVCDYNPAGNNGARPY
ncbi:MAG TPA: CAP domain-containing protein [Rudaea sp.]|nr:CAP domain-containing protein [Rudaea sp.]